VGDIFPKRFWRTSQFHEFFKNILTLQPCRNHDGPITWKVIVHETYFCEKILADIRVSWVFQNYL